MANQKETAEAIGIGVSTFRKLVADGHITAGRGRGGYNVEKVKSQYISHLQAKLRMYESGKDAEIEEVTDPLKLAKIREAELKVARMEIDHKRDIRELVPTDLLEGYARAVASTVYQAFEKLPGTLKKKVPGLRASDLNIVRRELAKASNVIADTKINYESAA